MFKIGLENRDFCKSLHFYIVDAGKKKKKKKKNELHLLACSAALGPSSRGHHYFLIVLRGACQVFENLRFLRKVSDFSTFFLDGCYIEGVRALARAQISDKKAELVLSSPLEVN